MKIAPVRSELLHADGRTDMTKLRAAFRNFANVPNNACRDLISEKRGEKILNSTNNYFAICCVFDNTI